MWEQTYAWLKAAHLIGMVVWVGGMFAVYWLLRIHSHLPRETSEKLTLMERSLALMMDLGAALAIGCGLVMAIKGLPGAPTNWFKQGKWLHIKLVFVILTILPVHGMLRARIKRFGQGRIGDVPAWQWSLLLAGLTATIVVASTKLATFDGS
jgi:uncharacterized membrane protein